MMDQDEQIQDLQEKLFEKNRDNEALKMEMDKVKNKLNNEQFNKQKYEN